MLSSSENLEYAYACRDLLAEFFHDGGHDFEVETWSYSPVFGRSTNSLLESFDAAIERYDFGVFLFVPDDETNKRGISGDVVRDNVLFEFGLFWGAMGRENCYILAPKGESLGLPSDIRSILPSLYIKPNDNTQKAIENTLKGRCNEIASQICESVKAKNNSPQAYPRYGQCCTAEFLSSKKTRLAK